MANAATMAGMAFANAFLGICHSMGHKLGAYHHLPHGITVSLVLDEVMRFNSAEVPNKMGTFPQYDHPHTLRRYAEIAEALNIGGANDYEKMENLISKIDELKERIGIKKTIREYGIEEQDFLATLDEMSEKALEDMTKEIKEEILSGLQESQNTIVLKKGTEYFDMADMQMLDTTKYKLERVVPLSQYATEEDFSVENDEENGLEFCIDDKVFERYLNEIEQ